MTALAGKTELNFEPKMGVALDAVATTGTPDSLTNSLGPLVQLNYRPARFKFHARTDQAPTQGAAEIRLMAGATVIYSQAVSLIGVTEITQDVAVDLLSLNGETPLKTEVEITTAADAGRTLTIDSRLEIAIPGVIAGC